MRVFVAGATGAIGKQQVPRLVAAGHEVHGMTRSNLKESMLKELGAVPVVADALDPDQVARAVGLARPDVIVHQLTAIPPAINCDTSIGSTRSPTGFAPSVPTTCCRRARRWASSASSPRATPACRTPVLAGRSSERTIRSTPIPRRPWRATFAAIRHLEDTVTGAQWADGLVLRYRWFYGPGLDRSQPTLRIRDRADPQAPVLQLAGQDIWSFIHI